WGPDGRPVPPGEVGELVCKKPWPGMTRGIWKDPQRYLETYWSRWPDVWVHGDWGSADRDGLWFLLGRAGEPMSGSGQRGCTGEWLTISWRCPLSTEGPDSNHGKRSIGNGSPHPVVRTLDILVLPVPGRRAIVAVPRLDDARDRDLVRQVRAGDEGAFRSLF